ncbi:acyl-CoA dehydrogenase family protein [Novosphingobium sp.]|jgi:resorcinol 4-hydroxylase (FADH2)|uniref:acyl-CoA dehydrogenase family protein n=1 Tax=Novosphingobium sp. TaxID=1874826 RepID=UPI002FDD5F17
MTQVMEREPQVAQRVDFGVLRDTARTIARLARQRADETQANRRVAPDIIAACWENGLLAMVKPARWGGHDCSFAQFAEIVFEIGKGDASTAWSFSVLAGHAANIALYPEQAQHDVWGENPHALVASAFAPTGKAVPVEGGYTLSGRFPFASGSDHADWYIVGAMALGADGHPFPHTFLVPRDAVAIIDDWRTMGLCGTGSKTLEIAETFVPAHRVMLIPPLLGGVAPLGLQAALIGSAWGALDYFVAEMRAKPAKWNALAPAQSEHVQVAVGESWADIHTAWSMLAGTIAQCDDHTGMNTPTYSDEQRRRNRAANSVISRLTNSAVERVMALAGGNGIYDTPLSRAVRDVRAGSQHMATNTNVAAMEIGKALLN